MEEEALEAGFLDSNLLFSPDTDKTAVDKLGHGGYVFCLGCQLYNLILIRMLARDPLADLRGLSSCSKGLLMSSAGLSGSLEGLPAVKRDLGGVVETVNNHNFIAMLEKSKGGKGANVASSSVHQWYISNPSLFFICRRADGGVLRSKLRPTQ